MEAKFGPPIADYLTPEPAAAIPAIDAEVVRTVVRECGYVYDLRLGWVRPVGGLAASTTVTRVVERLGGNPHSRRLRAAVEEALRTLHDNPPTAA
jgi:hypothetical protein